VFQSTSDGLLVLALTCIKPRPAARGGDLARRRAVAAMICYVEGVVGLRRKGR
jgi:hypothetical protein